MILLLDMFCPGVNERGARGSVDTMLFSGKSVLPNFFDFCTSLHDTDGAIRRILTMLLIGNVGFYSRLSRQRHEYNEIKSKKNHRPMSPLFTLRY